MDAAYKLKDNSDTEEEINDIKMAALACKNCFRLLLNDLIRVQKEILELRETVDEI